jgi:hypothetical protein
MIRTIHVNRKGIPVLPGSPGAIPRILAQREAYEITDSLAQEAPRTAARRLSLIKATLLYVQSGL